jgi:hypothetical protein
MGVMRRYTGIWIDYGSIKTHRDEQEQEYQDRDPNLSFGERGERSDSLNIKTKVGLRL